MLNAKQRRALRALPARQRAAAEENMRSQNSKRRGGATAKQGASGRRKGITKSANGKGHVHLRALNPFDDTPGYQLTPMVERTLKVKLVADTPFPTTAHFTTATLNPYTGMSLAQLSPNAQHCGVIKYGSEVTSGGTTTPQVGSWGVIWNNRISDKDYLIRAVNWGINVRYCGEARYARGQVAILFVDHIEGAHFNELSTLGDSVARVFSHPRASVVDMTTIARAGATLNVPILDDISFRSWKRVAPSSQYAATDEVGQPAVADPIAPETVEQSTFESKYNLGFRSVVIATRGVFEDRAYVGMTDASLPALRIRTVMDVEYRRGIDNDSWDADDSNFRNFATRNPSVAPTTAHSFMERAGQLVDTVRDAMAHPIAGMLMSQLGQGALALPALV